MLAFAGFMTALLIGLIAERKEHEAVNRPSSLKRVPRVLIGLLCISLLTLSASACMWRPEHDWTINLAEDSYGMEGDGSFSYISWGNHSTFVPVPFYGVVAIGAFVFSIPCFLGFCVVARKR
jgi:hypothetical protein